MKLRSKRGERIKSTSGYITILGQYEHILVAEKALGKPLPKGANVHHIDANRMNNDPRNLVVCPSKSYHWLIEMRGRAYDACGHADWVKCRYCGQYDNPKNMFIRNNPGRKAEGHPEGWHKLCSALSSRLAYKILGKVPPPGTEVLHIDGDDTNNDSCNLVICPTRAYRMLLARRIKALNVCGHVDWLRCKYCDQYDDPKNLSIKNAGCEGVHHECSKKYQLEWMRNKRKSDQSRHGI